MVAILASFVDFNPDPPATSVELLGRLDARIERVGSSADDNASEELRTGLTNATAHRDRADTALAQGNDELARQEIVQAHAELDRIDHRHGAAMYAPGFLLMLGVILIVGTIMYVAIRRSHAGP